MAKKKIEVKDVTEERPIVEIRQQNPDLVEIKEILHQIEATLCQIVSHLNGGF